MLKHLSSSNVTKCLFMVLFCHIAPKKKNLNFGFLSLSSGPCFIGRHFTVAIVFE